MSSGLTLSSGISMPSVGLGTWKSVKGAAAKAVDAALQCGYKHIDCAAVYGNEEEIGDVFEKTFSSGKVKREDVFITSKLWNTNHAPEHVLPACKKTLKDLHLEYLDLYLMHWPIAFRHGEEVFPVDADGKAATSGVPLEDTWKAMEDLVDMGLVKAIGISNCNIRNVKRIMECARIKPVVNQVEMHPYLPQQELVDFCKKHNIVITAYSPLGTADFKQPDEPSLLSDDIVVGIAKKYEKSAAQILIRWAVQRDTIVIPKSATPSRIKENLEVFDFFISAEDMDLITSLGESCPHRFVKPDWDNFFD
eukprot:TRINITY_DN1130_c0_g5_i1.p1 TRINITY_DN1130_c0_g5~~TRINITY_DN1130_c0_g5_i1.p1  ORF type:complete len:307 (+),score=87.16 TRINITY_DN1130_c0_g5_i1:498-1418(+)